MKANHLIQYIKTKEDDLYPLLTFQLTSMGYHIEKSNLNYLYGQKGSSILLVAHLDTFYNKDVNQVYYDTKHGILWSPQGIGGDDRCGIFAIMSIVKNIPCDVLFLSGEEVGGVGE